MAGDVVIWGFEVQVTKLETISPHWDAVEAPCEYASYCGGCKTQNLSYEAQLRAKAEQVRDLMVHVGRFLPTELESMGIMKPIVACDVQFHYRNKVGSLFLQSLNDKHLNCIRFLKKFHLQLRVLCRWSFHLVPKSGYPEKH